MKKNTSSLDLQTKWHHDDNKMNLNIKPSQNVIKMPQDPACDYQDNSLFYK